MITGKDSKAHKTLRLTQAALASTLFLIYTPISFAVLAPVPPNTVAAPVNDGFNFVANATLNVPDAVNIGTTAGISIDNNNGFPGSGFNVDVIFEGDSTVAGTVGPTNAITTIEIQGASSTVTFSANVNVGTGNLIFDGAADQSTFVAFLDNANLTGSIDNLTGLTGRGNVLFDGSSTVTGTIGANDPIFRVFINGAGETVNFQGNVSVADNIGFSGAANATTTARFSDGVTITGNVENIDGPGTGILEWVGGGLLTGFVGGVLPIAQVKINTSGSPSRTVEIQGDVVNAGLIAISDDGSGSPATGTTLKLNNSAMDLFGNITVATNNEDTLNIFNADTLNGNIGALNKAFNLVQVGQNSDVTINGDIFATNIIFFGPNELTLGDGSDINGSVDSTVANQGILNFAGDSTVTGTIGATNKVNAINLLGAGNTVTFLGNINVGTGNLTFAPTANPLTTAEIGNNVTITGNVDSLQAGDGILAFLGNGTILGTIGATNKLATVNITQADSLVTFGGNVLNGTPINFTADATINIADGVTLTGSIDNLTGVTPAGTVQFLGNALVNGPTIGATDGLRSLNILGANKTVTFDTTILNDTPIIFLANGTVVIQDGSTIFDVDNKTSTPIGTLVFEGGGTVGTIGATNPLLLVSVNTGGGVKTLNFNGTEVNANQVNVVGAGITTLNFAPTTASGMQIKTNITTNNNGVDVIQFQPTIGDITMVGNIGSPTNTFGSVELILAGNQLNMTGNIFADNTEFQDDGTLVLSNNSQVFGTITTTVNDQGTLTFLGNSTISEQVGALGFALSAVNVDGFPGTVVNLNAPVFTTDFSVNNGGTLQPSNGATLTTTNPLTINNGILRIPSNVVFNINGGLELSNANATLQIDMANSLTSAGRVVTTGAAHVAAPAKLTILNPAFSPGITSTIPIVVGGPGSNFVPAINITNSNNFLTTFATLVTGNTLNLQITSIPLVNFADQPNTGGVAQALDQIALSGTPLSGFLAQIIGQLSVISSPEALNFALSTLAPIVDGALVMEGFALENQIYDAIAERFDRRNGWRPYQRKSIRGISSGDKYQVDKTAWAKLIRYHANQQKLDGVEGYEAQAVGALVGGDIFCRNSLLLGSALSITDLDAHGKLLPTIKTAAKSYQLTIYGSKDFKFPYYLNGLMSFAYNKYSTERNIVFGNVNAFPRGDFHGWQMGLKGEMGYVFGKGNFHTIPIGNIFYSYLNVSPYTEHGANTADLEVKGTDFEALIAGAGLKIAYDFGYEQRLFQLQAYIMALYAFVNDKMEITSQFTGAGPSFVTSGFSPPKESLNLGGNFTLYTKTNWSLKLNYDLNLKEQYVSNAGSLRALYEW